MKICGRAYRFRHLEGRKARMVLGFLNKKNVRTLMSSPHVRSYRELIASNHRSQWFLPHDDSRCAVDCRCGGRRSLSHLTPIVAAAAVQGESGGGDHAGVPRRAGADSCRADFGGREISDCAHRHGASILRRGPKLTVAVSAPAVHGVERRDATRMTVARRDGLEVQSTGDRDRSRRISRRAVAELRVVASPAVSLARHRDAARVLTAERDALERLTARDGLRCADEDVAIVDPLAVAGLADAVRAPAIRDSVEYGDAARE